MEGFVVALVALIIWGFLKGLFSSEPREKDIGPLQARIRQKRLDQKDKSSPLIQEIEVRGLLPIERERNLGFVTSVFDETSGELEVVLSTMDMFQEPHTRAYQHYLNIGEINPGVAIIKWMRSGVIIPQVLETPLGGERNLAAIIRLVDLDNKPDITLGFHQLDHEGLLWQQKLAFAQSIEGKGYIGSAAEREKACVLSVAIAAALVVREKKVDPIAGEKLQNWMKKIIDASASNRRDAFKNQLNDALRKAYSEILASNYNITTYVRNLKELNDNSYKFQLIELCFDIMSTDGNSIARQLKGISLIAKALEFDLDEFEKIKDKKILTPSIKSSVSTENLLGIDPNWSRQQTQKYLRDQFRKWNNRITTLAPGVERDNAQKMLDAIAEARRKYE